MIVPPSLLLIAPTPTFSHLPSCSFLDCPKILITFCLPDTDGNGYISCNELNDLFKAACLPLPGYRVREITENLMATGDLDQDGRISFDEFIKVSVLQNIEMLLKLRTFILLGKVARKLHDLFRLQHDRIFIVFWVIDWSVLSLIKNN